MVTDLDNSTMHTTRLLRLMLIQLLYIYDQNDSPNNNHCYMLLCKHTLENTEGAIKMDNPVPVSDKIPAVLLIYAVKYFHFTYLLPQHLWRNY